MTTIQLQVDSNLGYSADQIETSMTLAELADAVQEAIDYYGDDAKVVLHEIRNRYGASYGKIMRETFEEVAEEDEEL